MQTTQHVFLMAVLFMSGVLGCYQSRPPDPVEDTDHELVSDAEDRNGHTGSSTPMVRIPAGPVLIGSDTSGCPWDEPLHEVYLDEFEIDVTEVTNRQYRECIEAGACEVPRSPDSLTRPGYLWSDAFSDYPVVRVTHEQAEAYCRWVGKRLPTEAEWEKAARGGCEVAGDPVSCESGIDARSWPWGDEPPTCELANAFKECFSGDTAPVGAFPRDRSPYGVLDMGGNVTELVNDWFRPDYYTFSEYRNPQGPSREQAEAMAFCTDSDRSACRVRKGDSFGGYMSMPLDPPPVSCRIGASGRSPGFDRGFRCAR